MYRPVSSNNDNNYVECAAAIHDNPHGPETVTPQSFALARLFANKRVSCICIKLYLPLLFSSVYCLKLVFILCAFARTLHVLHIFPQKLCVGLKNKKQNNNTFWWRSPTIFYSTSLKIKNKVLEFRSSTTYG